MTDVYEDYFGIFPHLSTPDGVKPLASIAFHRAENTVDYSHLKQRMRTFAESRVGILFNITFDEFMNRPFPECRLMLEVALQLNKSKTAAISDIERELKDLQ